MTFVFDIENVAADLSTAQLVDRSEYGGANPDRDELALYAYLYKRDASDVDTAITLDNTDPENVTAYDFALPSNDGNFVYIMFGFPIWLAGSYTQNNCVYYNGLYYKANTNTSQTPGGGQWDLISDILAEVLNLSNSNVTITQGYAFSSSVVEAGPLGDELADLGPRFIAGRCKNINDMYWAMVGGALIQSGWMNFRRQEYTKAQNIMDWMDQSYANFAS